MGSHVALCRRFEPRDPLLHGVQAPKGLLAVSADVDVELLEPGGHVFNRNREPGDHLPIGGVPPNGPIGGHDQSGER